MAGNFHNMFHILSDSSKEWHVIHVLRSVIYQPSVIDHSSINQTFIIRCPVFVRYYIFQCYLYLTIELAYDTRCEIDACFIIVFLLLVWSFNNARLANDAIVGNSNVVISNNIIIAYPKDINVINHSSGDSDIA